MHKRAGRTAIKNQSTMLTEEENMSIKFEGGTAKQKSNNLYQIFAYVNNWNVRGDENVGGMLLYAKTTAKEQPNHHYKIKGSKISVLNLDLSQGFEEIKADLTRYTDEFFKLM